MIDQLDLFPCCNYHKHIPSVVWSSDGITRRIWVSCEGIAVSGVFVICCDDCKIKDRRPQFADRYMTLDTFKKTCNAKQLSEYFGELPEYDWARHNAGLEQIKV